MFLHSPKQEKKNKHTPFILGKIHSDIDKVKLILRKKDKIFYQKHHHLFAQLKQSRQRFIDTINLDRGNGNTKSVKLFLVQHNLAFGPGQGVLKFIKQINLPKKVRMSSLQKARDIVEKLILDDVEATATAKSLHHVLHNMKLGGACCAVTLFELKVVDNQIKMVPIQLTDIEEAALAREIGYRLVKYHIMGPESFWPEPDNSSTNEQILNWVEDEALKTLSSRQMLTPRDKNLFETLNKIHVHLNENQNPNGLDSPESILKTPYHDAAVQWLNEWRATRRGEIAIEELLSKKSKVGRQYRRQILRMSLKYRVFPSLAKKILAVQRLLTVMNLPFKDYKPNGQIVILDTGIAPAIVERNILNLKELYDEDVLVISVLAKRLGGSSPKMILQLCRIYVEAAYNLGAKIVLLCNTMDANARAVLDKEFSIPILGPIKPAVNAAVQYWESQNPETRNIGVIATEATIRSKAYENEIKRSEPAAKVFNVVAPLLATLVDMNTSNNAESEIMSQKNISILEANLLPLINRNIDTLILGCTHYGVFEQAIHDFWIRRTGRDIYIVDSSRELPNYTATYLKENRILSLRSGEHRGTKTHMASEEDVTRFKQGVFQITGINAEVIPMDIGEVVGRLGEEDRLFQETVYKESKEDINLRAIIINSNLSAEAKVSISDKLYGAGNVNSYYSDGEILRIDFKDEYLRELVWLAIRNKDMLHILSSVTGSDLHIIEQCNEFGVKQIFVRSTTQNYFIIGENKNFIHVLLQSNKNFIQGLLSFKSLNKYILVNKLDLSFFNKTVATYHQRGELDKFNEALKICNKIKQKMEWDKEYPKHSGACAIKVKQYLERIGFLNVQIETKKTDETTHSYVTVILLNTEVIIDICASRFELIRMGPGVFYMRDIGIVVIPRLEVARVQKSDPISLFFYHGRRPSS